ncbi:MAG: DMT family transporter [Patescibacteria group bacterium]|nr:DMT family transporter [Patescibacteria group bacterium]
MNLGIIFAIAAGFLWSVTNLLDKTVVTKYIRKVSQIYLPLSLVSLLMGGVALIYDGQIPKIGHLLLIVIAAILWIIMGYVYFRSAQLEEISRVAPLFALTPVLILIFSGIFLNEIFSLKIYLGIIIILVGSILILSRGNLKQIFKSRVLGLMIVSATGAAGTAIIEKYLSNYYNYWSVFGWIYLMAGLLGLVVFYRSIKEYIILRHESDRRGFWLMIVSEGNSGLANFAYITAMSFWYISLVSAASTIQYLFVFLWTLLLAKLKPGLINEEINRKIAFQKIVAIIFIIGGIFLIT